jgi:Mycothiol maleylpyruvate isomerase N-terminal domain
MTEDAAIDEPLLLAECWQHWAERCAPLGIDGWTAATRCAPWDVAALVAHVAPDPVVLEQVTSAVLDGEAAVTDPAALLRGFNEPGAVAFAMAGEVAARATELAQSLDAVAVVGRFVEGASIVLREPALPLSTVVAHPIVGSTTVGVLTAVVEATVHYLDLLDAIGGEPLPTRALHYTRDVLVRVSEPAPLIEAMTGRRNPLTWFPLIH